MLDKKNIAPQKVKAEIKKVKVYNFILNIGNDWVNWLIFLLNSITKNIYQRIYSIRNNKWNPLKIRPALFWPDPPSK